MEVYLHAFLTSASDQMSG